MDLKHHAANVGSPWQMLLSPLNNANLIYQMAKREVIGRYRGSIIGLAWSFFNPILMLGIYTFVFSVAFKSRWAGVGAEASKIDFAIIFFCGLIIHGFVAECINRAPTLILSNANFVKKVVFPLEILPWVACGSALFHMAISIGVLLVAQVAYAHTLPWTVVLFPLVLLPLVLGTMGVTWFIASLGVYVRDIGQMTGMITTILLFMSPIFFPLSAMPEEFQPVMRLNPLVFFLDAARNTLIFGKGFDVVDWLIALAAGAFVAGSGFAWFQRSRRGFADVL